MKTNVDGGCLCGATRYRLTAEPASLGDCHCVDCRRASGAPYVTWGTVPRGAREMRQGELRVVQFAGRVRSFAACCGTPLFFAEAEDSPTLDFTVASLDDPTPFAPQKAIWTEDRLPWVTLDPRHPVFARGSGEGAAS